MQKIAHNWPIFLFLLILLTGVFFRFWQLDMIPPGIFPDEAKNANDAITAFTQNEYKVFYPENNGREGLYINLVALSFKYLGVNMLSFKLVGALAGILTIIITYFLVKEFFTFAHIGLRSNSYFRDSRFAQEAVALLVSGFLATSFWHTNFSRIGFRAILLPLGLALATYITLRALRTFSLPSVALAGMAWGGVLHTYIAARFSILIPFFVILATLFIHLANLKVRSKEGSYWSLSLLKRWGVFVTLFFGMFTVVTFPLMRYFVNNPQDFVGRAIEVSVLGAPSPIYAFFQSVIVHLQMFFLYGDFNWRHNFSGEPQLLWPIAILFVVGILYGFSQILRAARSKEWYTVVAYATLFVWVGTLLLPASTTIESIPHALRAIGILPAVYIFAGLGFLGLHHTFFSYKKLPTSLLPLGVVGIVVLLIAVGSIQFNRYFEEWSQRKEVAGAFTKQFVSIGEFFNTLSPDTKKVLVVNRSGVLVTYPNSLRENLPNIQLPMPAQTVLFVQQTKEISPKETLYILPQELPLLLLKRAVIVPLDPTSEVLTYIANIFPSSQPLPEETGIKGFMLP